ncbi:MAG: peroxiredoxin family protein [Myxococcales bacterium]
MALLVAALLATAPPLALTDTSGAKHRLSDYRGKAVLVNFWATWCEPCREELPSLERLRASLASKPFAVLAVQMGGSPRTARDIVQELGLRFPVLLDSDSSVTNAWQVSVLPTTFLIAPDGSVAAKHVGGVDWAQTEWRRKVEALLPRSP